MPSRLTDLPEWKDLAAHYEEVRGVHLRDDFQERDDEHWRRHITLRLPDIRPGDDQEDESYE